MRPGKAGGLKALTRLAILWWGLFSLPGLLCCAAEPGASGDKEEAQPDAVASTDPDVLAKVRKLIRNTLKEEEGDREKAWKELREMGNLAVPGLLGVYRSSNCTPEMTVKILLALGDSKDPRAGPALVEVLDNPDPQIRLSAARALGDCEFKDKVALKRLSKHFKDSKEDEEVRYFAASAAAKMGSEDGLQILKELLKAEKPALRTRAVYALGKHGGKSQVKAIVLGLKDMDAGVREDTIEALRLLASKVEQRGDQGKVKHTPDDVTLFEALIAATGDADYKVRGAATGALRDLTGLRLPNEKQAWEDWWNKTNEK